MTPFSVLMPVDARESASNLRAALGSVFDQTLPPSEVVVVIDSQLPAELNQVIEEYARNRTELKLVSLPKRRGLGPALNAGLEACTHPIVARMDSDDVCVRHRFERQIGRISGNEELALVGSSIAEFANDPRQVRSVRPVPVSHSEIVQAFGIRCPVNHPTVVYRKQAVQDCGGYSQEFIQEDYHLWAKMIVSGCKFENVGEPLVLMRTGEGLFDRRGGRALLWSETELQIEFRRMGLLGYPQMAFNIVARGTVRLLPSTVRRFLYMTFLRTRWKRS